MLIMKLNETAMFMKQKTIGYLFRTHFRVILNKLYEKILNWLFLLNS